MWFKKLLRYYWGSGALVALVAIACGASATSAPVPDPTPTSASADTAPSQTTAGAVTPSPAGSSQGPAATEVSGESQTLVSFDFSWDILDVDDGVKPAIALTSEDVPFVAYMLEASPGFVKNAVWNGTGWDIATLSTGYFYGPLDIAIGPDDAAHISYHDHDEEDAA